MDKIPNQALAALMDSKLSNLALVCLTYLLRQADNCNLKVDLADMRRVLGYKGNHGTYYAQIRAAMTELNGTFIQYREEVSPVAASTAAKEGRNVVFSVVLHSIFFEFQKNEKNQICDFTSLPRLADLPKLRAKYHMRTMFLALRWQSGKITPSMSLPDFKQWFDMPQKWKPSEVLEALICAQRIALSLGLYISFTLPANKRQIAIVAQRTEKVQISNEKPTAYRKRQKLERRQAKARVLSELRRQNDAELANFARAAADKYRGTTFVLNWLGKTIVRIESGTGLLVTEKGRYLSEANTRRFYLTLMAKEEAIAATAVA
jgi:hypothetical protein